MSVKNQVILAKIAHHQALITWWQTRILSGENSTRLVSRGLDGPRKDENALRRDALDAIERHCNLIGELVENMDRDPA